MLRKKVLLLLMLVTMLVSLSTAGGASASCSGDICGCGETAAWCRDSCQEIPAGPGRFACVQQCNRESIACARGCCSPDNY